MKRIVVVANVILAANALHMPTYKEKSSSQNANQIGNTGFHSWVSLATIITVFGTSCNAQKVIHGQECTVTEDGDGAFHCIESPKEWREQLKYPVDKPIAPPLPRVDISEFDNSRFSDLTEPFILTGAMEGWRILDTASDLSGKLKPLPLIKELKSSIADYYPFNLNKAEYYPYLIRYQSGWEDFTSGEESVFGEHDEVEHGPAGKYLHYQFTPEIWKSIIEEKNYVPKDRHPFLEAGGAWMDDCLTPELKEEFFLKNHWMIWLAGQRGAGMFEHYDAFPSSSWHGHVEGRKWWFVCTHNQDQCWETIARPGELLFYPEKHWHKTQCVDLAVTITGTIATQSNHASLSAALQTECIENFHGFLHSGKLCDALEKCYDSMSEQFGTKGYRHIRKSHWRNYAQMQTILGRDNVQPRHNNYDGRYDITE